MSAYVLPFILVIFSNVFYQISAKSLPEDLNPLASLTVTYLVSAFATLILFFLTARGTSLLKEYAKINWTTFLLGAVIIGLEVGMIYCYKAGWPASTLMIVVSAVAAIFLLFVGHYLYKEAITANKLIGCAICLVGLYFINK